MLAQEEYVEVQRVEEARLVDVGHCPCMWEETEEQYELTFLVSVSLGSGGRRSRIRSMWSRLMLGSGWPRIPIFGQRHCSTKPRGWGMGRAM